jgi:uncharacterized cupin superfamily protein
MNHSDAGAHEAPQLIPWKNARCPVDSRKLERAGSVMPRLALNDATKQAFAPPQLRAAASSRFHPRAVAPPVAYRRNLFPASVKVRGSTTGTCVSRWIFGIWARNTCSRSTCTGAAIMSVSLRRVSPEAAARETKYGLVHDERGWFVVNARDERWNDTGPFGFYCNFEGKKPFPQLGININVLEPGQAIGAYHREAAQEGFLVLAGECLAIVEDEEVPLRAWDYFHCPPGTGHAVLGAGEGQSVILAVGRRGLPRKGIEYLEDERVPPRSGGRTRVRYREGWLPKL